MPDNSYLAHHGILGMRWGVHNDETKRKYGELPAGYKLKRITNTEEIKRLDKSKRLYASMNESDFKTYAKMTNFLPSTYNKGDKISILSMELKKDAKFADGQTAVNKALEKALGKTLDEFQKQDLEKKLIMDEQGKQYSRSFKQYADIFNKKHGESTLRDVLNSTPESLKAKDPESWVIANELVNMAVGGTVGSFAKQKHQQEYLDKMKKEYDIIVDPEDVSAKGMPDLQNLKEPVIILNPEETIGTIESKVVSKKKLAKYARK